MSELSVCLYPNGLAVVCERCVLSPQVGYATFEYGPVPPQIDVSSFRCFFDDPSAIRLRDYHIVRSKASKRVIMGIDTLVGGPQLCTMVYQTGGLQWQVWYDCVLGDRTATLSSWIAVVNMTPLTYSGVELRFISASPSGLQHEQRLFTTERQVTLSGMETSHIELITVPDIPILSRLVAPVDSPIIQEDLYIHNSSECGLGIDLPPGPIRIYENRPWPIHTDSGYFPVNSPGDDISLRSFPVEDVTIYGGWDYGSGIADLYIRNDRGYDVIVQVEESERKDDIIEASHRLVEVDEGVRYFPVTVRTNSTGQLRYRVSDEALLRGRPPGYGMQTSPVVTMQPVGSHLPRQPVTP